MTNLLHKSSARKIFFVLVLYLVVAPILWVVDRTTTYLFLQLLSLPIFYWFFIDSQARYQINKTQALLILAILVSIALFLVPIPMWLWAQLPGRAGYAEIVGLNTEVLETGWRAISIVPEKTERALWVLLPPIATYLAVIVQPKVNIKKLVLIVIGVAVFQSALGLIQYGGGFHGIFSISDSYSEGQAVGTYYNRDHLAGFLEMVFPVTLSLLAAMLGGHLNLRRQYKSRRQHWSFWATIEGNRSLLYGLAAILIVICIVFTRSRTGIALTMLGLVLVLMAFARRLGGNNVYGPYGTVVALIVILAIEIGLVPIFDRFSMDPMQDLRWEIFATSMQGVGDFFPLGSGSGTFPYVYPIYQLPHDDHFINHAHNDYLEWIFDGGILAAAIIVFALYLYFKNWKVIWINGKWRVFRFIQVGAGIGVLMMILHSLIDFNLHKPVNAIYFAFFLAVFMKPDSLAEADVEKVGNQS